LLQWLVYRLTYNGNVVPHSRPQACVGFTAKRLLDAAQGVGLGMSND
jgi:hypothetical protein